MTHGTWPNAVSFDPEGGAARVWEETLATPGARVRALLVISGEAARYSGWSARAVIALADELAGRQPVILADLHFEQPELDGLVGVRDAEGFADAALFGASLDHVTLASPDHRFELIPTGGPVADTEAVYRSAAWPLLLEEASRRNAALILYVPWRARGLEALVGLVDSAVMLGGATDTRLAQGYLPHDLPVRAVLSPGTPKAGGPPPTAVAARTSAAEPAAVTVPESGPRRRFRWALPLLILLGAAGAAAVALISRDPAELEPAPPPAAAPGVAAGEPAGEPLPFAVAIETHPELAAASERIAALRTAEPGTAFFVAPILVDSALDYRVMAGPVADSAAAAAVMDSLIAHGHKAVGSAWDVRNAPLAFELGVYDTAGAAAARVAELAALEIPAYALEVPYSGGGRRFHVYCGAWAGPAEADVMRQVLEAVAVPATLVQRIGRSTT